MRKVSLFIIVTLTLVIFSSCNSCSERNEPLTFEEMITLTPQYHVVKTDTTEVVGMTHQFLDALQAKNYDKAMSMLFYLDDKDKIVSLPSDEASKLRKVFTTFPVLSYSIDRYVFYRETDNLLRYTIIFGMSDDQKSNKKIQGMLRPVRRNGKWYLTPADTHSETHDSKLKDY